MIRARKMFFEFARLSLMGFGGVFPLLYHSMIERNGWVSREEFAELLSIGQMLPGGNAVNISAMIGWRCAGLKGACTALAGLLILPMLILFAIAIIYHKISTNHFVAHAVTGMSAIAAGLVVATALKLALAQAKKVKIAIFSIIIFTLIILLHWSLLKVILYLAPLALLIEIKFHRNLTKISS